MSEERLRKDINRLKRLNNGCIPEYHQDIEDVLDRLEYLQQENQQLKEIIEQNKITIHELETTYRNCAFSPFEGTLQILDKVKE